MKTAYAKLPRQLSRTIKSVALSMAPEFTRPGIHLELSPQRSKRPAPIHTWSCAAAINTRDAPAGKAKLAEIVDVCMAEAGATSEIAQTGTEHNTTDPAPIISDIAPEALQGTNIILTGLDDPLTVTSSDARPESALSPHGEPAVNSLRLDGLNSELEPFMPTNRKKVPQAGTITSIRVTRSRPMLLSAVNQVIPQGSSATYTVIEDVGIAASSSSNTAITAPNDIGTHSATPRRSPFSAPSNSSAATYHGPGVVSFISNEKANHKRLEWPRRTDNP